MPMNRADANQAALRRAAALTACACGYLGAYFASTVVRMPLLWHLPVEHRFTFEVRPLALGADFYGRILVSLVSGAAALLVARWALGAASYETVQRWQVRLLRWAFILMAFTGGLYAYTLSSREPIPAPLPAGYVPR